MSFILDDYRKALMRLEGRQRVLGSLIILTETHLRISGKLLEKFILSVNISKVLPICFPQKDLFCFIAYDNIVF